MAEIDGKVCVPDKQISKKPQKVSITFMDEPSDESEEKIISVIDKKRKTTCIRRSSRTLEEP